ncbi:hypothetical protein ASPWEDRAFT_36160, partial [Aspergillus wentii DTO 134E9]
MEFLRQKMQMQEKEVGVMMMRREEKRNRVGKAPPIYRAVPGSSPDSTSYPFRSSRPVKPPEQRAFPPSEMVTPPQIHPFPLHPGGM